MHVEGSTVLVTGASSGVGAALAPMLAERGATVGIVARRADRLEEVLARCRAATPDSRMWAVDLADLDAAERTARDAWDAFDGLDALVNNAGIPKRRHVSRLHADEVDHVMRVNFTAPIRMTLALLPGMLARGSGTIVNVSSMGGRIGIAREAAYCASKFALCGWSESMAIDLHGTGVEVKLVLPGPIETEIWDQPGNDPAHYSGPFVSPEECAASIAACMESTAFECYAPPELPGGGLQHDIVVDKARDPGAFLELMGRFYADS